MRFSLRAIKAGVEHLRGADPVMADLIDRVGPYRLRPQRDRFGMLVRSIISQQISVKAARSIRARLEALVAPDRPTAANLARLTLEQLRSAGLSPQKGSYVHDLSEKVRSGAVRLDRIGRLTDEEVIAELIQVKGIGRWTAQMFLIFSLGRLDIFPYDDLGVRSAMRRLYGLDELPTRAASELIAAKWRPYCSIASWYCWRSFDVVAVEAKPDADYPV